MALGPHGFVVLLDAHPAVVGPEHVVGVETAATLEDAAVHVQGADRILGVDADTAVLDHDRVGLPT